MKPIKIKKQLEKLSKYKTEYNERKIEKFVPTTLEFYPNYPNNLVRVALLLLTDNKTWRVCMWGLDDCGYEFDTNNFKLALDSYNNINYIDKIPEGFRPA